MGACGEEKKSSNNNNNKKIQLETNEDKISEKDIKAIEETEKEVFKSIPKPKKNYTIKFINEEKNDEFNDTIDGDITLNQILINMRTRNNSDFMPYLLSNFHI